MCVIVKSWHCHICDKNAKFTEVITPANTHSCLSFPEGPLQLEAPRAEAVHQQEDASLEGRQLAEGRPMQAAGAAQIAADGEAPML